MAVRMWKLLREGRQVDGFGGLLYLWDREYLTKSGSMIKGASFRSFGVNSVV